MKRPSLTSPASLPAAKYFWPFPPAPPHNSPRPSSPWPFWQKLSRKESLKEHYESFALLVYDSRSSRARAFRIFPANPRERSRLVSIALQANVYSDVCTVLTTRNTFFSPFFVVSFQYYTLCVPRLDLRTLIIFQTLGRFMWICLQHLWPFFWTIAKIVFPFFFVLLAPWRCSCYFLGQVCWQMPNVLGKCNWSFEFIPFVGIWWGKLKTNADVIAYV